MYKIDMLKFSNKIYQIIPLYRYLSIIVNETNVASRLKEVEFDWYVSISQQFLINKDESSVQEFRKFIEPIYENYISQTLKDGLKLLKCNLLVSAYSTFELFLDHVVSIYCSYFPKLYMNNNIKIDLKRIESCNSEEQRRQYYIERFVEDFGFKRFNEKISFIKNKLKLSHDYIWELKDKDYTIEINEIRNKIVHSEIISEIYDDKFYEYIEYINSVIFKISATTQADHGIEFIWIKDANINIKMADNPIL